MCALLFSLRTNGQDKFALYILLIYKEKSTENRIRYHFNNGRKLSEPI